MRKVLFGCAFFLCTCIFSQIKVEDSRYSAEELVEDILINSPCAQVSNVTFSTGTATAGINGIGYFTKNNSTFPIESGIILSSGRASNAPGPNNGTNSESNDGDLSWAGDRDLEQAVGIAANSTTYNATVLEFDFVPTVDKVSFRFLFASEEYSVGFECQYSDAFAFLLKRAGTNDPYTNLAVIPNTATPIKVTTVHPPVNTTFVNCPAANQTYFGRYNTGTNASNSPIVYNGQTKVLTASTGVTPNVKYHIKLVIADERDEVLDSAVFLEAGSFDLGGNLGDDRTSANGNPGCDGTPVVLDASIGLGASYKWFKDGTEIQGATSATLSVTTKGSYRAEVELAGTCKTTLGPINIEFTTPPVLAAPPENMVVCETDGNSTEEFDFSANTNLVLGGQNAADFPVSYHLTQADANDNKDPIATTYTNTAPTQRIFVRIADKTQTCYLTSSFTIEVQDLPTAHPVTPYETCDDALDGDDTNGSATFDLTTKTAELLGTQSPSEYTVKYYYDQAAADLGAAGTEITGAIQNSSNPQTIVARLENVKNTACFITLTFDLMVNPLPVIAQSPVELKQCDDDVDGISSFNLNEANDLLSKNAVNETFSYYLSLADAQAGTNKIVDPTSYTNPAPSGSVVYARIETSKGCFRTGQVNLTVGTTQIPSTFQLNYAVCDDYMADNDNTNGIASFDFSDATAQIKALFPAGQRLSVTYYENIADALAEQDAIADIADHRNTASPNTQNIYVRVDSDDVNACLGLGSHITLQVKPLPDANAITPYVLCSDSDTATFDLQIKNSEVLGTQTQDILISYHTSLTDAENYRNPIPVPFSNTANPQTIYVRAQFDVDGDGVRDPEECFSTDMHFDLVVNQNPIIVPGSLTECSYQVDTIYDLTQAKKWITKGDDTITLAYYETQNDVNADNPIADPTNYMNPQLQRDIIVVAKGTNNCTLETLLSLQTVLYPKLNKTPDPIEECEVDNNGFDVFDLTVRETQILNGLPDTGFIFTYYEDKDDAETGNSNGLSDPSNFTNTQQLRQTIYVRVKPVANDCHQVISIDLIVNPVPEIAMGDQYVLCLDENRIPLPPLPRISTKLDPSLYDFEWYEGTGASANNIIPGATDPNFSPGKIGMYTVRAIDKKTGCDIFRSTEVIPSYPPVRIEVKRTSETFSQKNVLEVSVVGDGQYEFKLDGGPYQDTPIFRDVLAGKHVITVRDIYRCDDRTTQIMVIDYPRFFTPNGDGRHETWNIVGIDQLSDARIYIYDRYGKLLNTLDKNSTGWDGTYNGSTLPSNDYWFRILYSEDGVTKVFKSHFSLKR